MPAPRLVFVLSDEPEKKLGKDFASFLIARFGVVPQRVAYSAISDPQDSTIFTVPYGNLGHYEARVRRLAEAGNHVFVLADGLPYEERELHESILRSAGGTEPGRLAGLEGMVYYSTVDRTGFEAMLKDGRMVPAETVLGQYLQ